MVFTLKQARRMRERTQQEMADVLHINIGTYRKLENHPEDATIAQAVAMARFLEFRFNEIFLPASST